MVALLVVCAGTAIASIPSGSGTHFSVQDRAVTIIASGSGGEGGTYTSGTHFFVPAKEEAMTFTAAANGECLVSLNGQVVASSGQGAKLQPGIAVRVSGGEPEFVGNHGFTTTRGDFSGTDDGATLTKNELIPVEAGKTYVIGWGIEVPSGAGTAFPLVNYVCFG